MASSPSQIDCLSALPDELLITILSLLPTRTAARTSVLCRRFRHLWKASPSVDLSVTYDRFGGPRWKSSVSMANSALLSRTPSNPLLRLSLKIYTDQLPLPCDLTDSFISSLFVHAHALGLRHLTICGFWKFEDTESVHRSVFSIGTLESLSIGIDFTFPSQIAFTRLRSLSINFTTENSTEFQRLLSELCCLEDLHLSVSAWVKNICLSSHTIKKLELFINYIQNESLGLSMPSLETLEFIYLKIYSRRDKLLLIHGEIPLIRKAVITIRGLRQKHIAAVAQLLNFISHVEELSLDLEEYSCSDYPFCVLIEPGKEVPTFRNLKHLDMSIRFHECNFEAVVMMLHRSTALESVKLHHKSHAVYSVTGGKGNAWRSKLPRNRDGNYQYACFKNLHLGENREEFKKLLNKKCTPKRQRVGS